MMFNFSGLTLARVVQFHPHDNSCDCQLLVDGSRLTGVPVMCQMMTTSSGLVDNHAPEGNAWDAPGSATRDVIAIVGKLHENPLVLGFLAKPVSEMLFKRANFRVDRHASDVYSTIDDAGNVELHHPSGTFVRIAEDPEHEDLTGKDWDRLWRLRRNLARRPWLSVGIKNEDGVMATFRVDPQGNVTVQNAGTLQVESAGDVTVTAPNVTINAAVAINGPSLTHNGTNVGDSHVHGGILPGPAETMPPS